MAVIQEAWISGVSTRRVDELVQAMGLSGIGKARYPSCAGHRRARERLPGAPLDRRVAVSVARRHLSQAARGGRIVSVAAIIAVAVNTEGKREIVGLHIGPSEAETFWATFLKSLVRRGLRGVKLVITDAHEGLKAAIRRVFGRELAALPRALDAQCAVLRAEGPAEHGRGGAAPGVHPARPRRAPARRCAMSPTSCGPKWPKLAAFMDDSETDVLSLHGLPCPAPCQAALDQSLERLNKEVKRRADVVGIFPNEGAIIRLIGAVLLEQNDEWLLQHRYMQVEAMAELIAPTIDAEPNQITADAA